MVQNGYVRVEKYGEECCLFHGLFRCNLLRMEGDNRLVEKLYAKVLEGLGVQVHEGYYGV